MRASAGFALWAASLVITSVSPAALVSLWRGEHNANDSVGPNNGLVTGTINYTPGVSGHAFLFPDSGYINVPNPAAGGLVSPNGFTFAAWVRFDGADPPPEGGPGAIVNYGTSANSCGFVIMQSGLTGGSSPVSFLLNTSGAQSFTVLTGPYPFWNLGQVYHLAATFDATTHTMALYRDGQLEASRSDIPGTIMATDPAAKFAIGRSIFGGATLEGMMDEARFYSHPLSASEVAGLVPEPSGLAILPIAASAFLSRRFR